jgi:hypothetical protein
LKLLTIVPGYGKIDNALKHYADEVILYLKSKDINSTFNISEITSADLLFLNYSCYGFHRRGVPILFIFKIIYYSRMYNKKIYIFFHELYADSNNPLKSSYWLHWIQKLLCFILFSSSKYSYCSNERMYDLLHKMKPNAKLKNIGIISNIPANSVNLNYYDRNNVAIVFGTPEQRQLVYKNSDLLKKICNSLNLKKILDIGPFIDQHLLPKFDFIEIVELGFLKKDKVSEIMGISRYGFMYYDYSLLSKSGILASYACNELTVLNFNSCFTYTSDKLIPNTHFWIAKDYEVFNISDSPFLAKSLKMWYHNNVLDNHFLEIYNSIISFN